MEDVIAHKNCIPYKVHTRHIGRTAQAKKFKATLGRWPEKSARYILQLLKNL